MADEQKPAENGGKKPPKGPEIEIERPVPFYVIPEGNGRWGLKESNNPGFWSCVVHGCLPEDLLEPSCWANVARYLRPCQLVEVHWDDRSHLAEYYVLDCGRNWANVDIWQSKRFRAAVRPHQATQYGIAFNGPVDKFRITRLNDGAVIKAGFASENDARKFLEEYLRKLQS